MAWWILLGALAAFGLLSAGWTLLGWLLPEGGGFVVVPCGAGELLRLRRYLWLRNVGLIRRVVVVDLGMQLQERCRLEKDGIEICSPETMASGCGIGAEEN